MNPRRGVSVIAFRRNIPHLNQQISLGWPPTTCPNADLTTETFVKRVGPILCDRQLADCVFVEFCARVVFNKNNLREALDGNE
jgi:hypothetical protein